jgi:hypothetical protein
MKYTNGYTEQCQNWSEYFTARINGHAAQATAYDRQAAACPQPAGHPRIIDHAVHALWQTPLPVCDRTRAWPQILSLGEQSRETSSPHLCPPGDRRADSGAIVTAPHLSHPSGGAVRHRLRVTHATRRLVARTNVVGQLPCGGLSRCDGCQSTGRQHVRTRSERPSLAQAVTAGGASCTRR